MKVMVRKTYVTFWREPDEPRVRNESELLYRLKLVLNKRGYGLVKKLMYKDGHLVDGLQHYLRRRELLAGSGRVWAIHDPDYASVTRRGSTTIGNGSPFEWSENNATKLSFL